MPKFNRCLEAGAEVDQLVAKVGSIDKVAYEIRSAQFHRAQPLDPVD
jgi:hypothetical protein